MTFPREGKFTSSHSFSSKEVRGLIANFTELVPPEGGVPLSDGDKSPTPLLITCHADSLSRSSLAKR